MSNELQVVPKQIRAQSVTEIGIQQLGTLMYQSGFFGDIKEASQACVKVLAGQELGIPPVASMMGISVIKGKLALGANLIAAQVKKHGYDYRVRYQENDGCEIEFLSQKEEGKRESLGFSKFREADAKAAGLLTKEVWRNFPRNMYFARAMSNGQKWFCPEATNGNPVYTPEELGQEVDENGEITSKAKRKNMVEEGKEAQAQVVTEKLAAIERQREGGKQGGSDESGVNANASQAETIADADSDTTSGHHPPADIPEDPIPEGTKTTRRKATTTAYDFLGEVRKLKDSMIAACGGSDEHYRTLLRLFSQKQAYEKSNQITDPAEQKLFLKELQKQELYWTSRAAGGILYETPGFPMDHANYIYAVSRKMGKSAAQADVLILQYAKEGKTSAECVDLVKKQFQFFEASKK